MRARTKSARHDGLTVAHKIKCPKTCVSTSLCWRHRAQSWVSHGSFSAMTPGPLDERSLPKAFYSLHNSHGLKYVVTVLQSESSNLGMLYQKTLLWHQVLKCLNQDLTNFRTIISLWNFNHKEELYVSLNQRSGDRGQRPASSKSVDDPTAALTRCGNYVLSFCFFLFLSLVSIWRAILIAILSVCPSVRP